MTISISIFISISIPITISCSVQFVEPNQLRQQDLRKMMSTTCSVMNATVFPMSQGTAAFLPARCRLHAQVNAPYRRRQLLQRADVLVRGGPRPFQCACSRHETVLESCKDATAGFKTVGTSVLAAILLFSLTWPAESQAAVQHLHHSEAFQLATGDSDFWVNVSRYGRYFITVLLGTAYITVKPLLQLLKRPKTAIAVILGLVALYLFVSTTVQAMLGVSNPLEYQPSGFFPDNY